MLFSIISFQKKFKTLTLPKGTRACSVLRRKVRNKKFPPNNVLLKENSFNIETGGWRISIPLVVHTL